MEGEELPAEAEEHLKLEAYRIALQTRNLEINLFWQRSNYFLVLNTAIAIGFFARDEQDCYAFLLSIIGLVVAVLWVLINLGSKFWQSRWERRLEIVENGLLPGFDLFAASKERVKEDVRKSLEYGGPDEHWHGRLYKQAVLTKPSVSKIMTALSAFFVIVWVVVAVASGHSAFF